MRKIYFILPVGAVLLLGGFFLWVFLQRPEDKATPISSPELNRPLGSDETRKKETEEVALLFVGDIMLSRFIGTLMEEKNNWVFPFQKIADATRAADITIGNLEGPISARGERVGSMYSFRADPRAVEGLRFAGFDVLSIANNHILDYGADAFFDTLRILDENGIQYAGGGMDYGDAHTARIVDIRGTKIAFLAYTNLISRALTAEESVPAVAGADAEAISRDIEKAKKRADIVVVLFHWGDEYAPRHNALQEDLAHAAIDAGAKLVIGHHPHVIQDTEKYNGGFIAYSLGNFVFDQNFSEETKRGLMLKIILRSGAIEKIEEIPISFNSAFQPIEN